MHTGSTPSRLVEIIKSQRKGGQVKDAVIRKSNERVNCTILGAERGRLMLCSV